MNNGVLPCTMARERRRDFDRGHVVFAFVVLDRPRGSVQIRFPRQSSGDAFVETCDTPFVHVFDRRQLHLLDRLPRCALDDSQHVSFARRDEQNRVAAATGTSGATDAMHVRLGVIGHVEIDDVTDALHIQVRARPHRLRRRCRSDPP